MAKPFDATTKQLIELRPRDWLALAGLTPPGEVEVIDADLATVTTDADRVLRAGPPNPSLFHYELQSSRDDDMPLRMLRYNVLLSYGHRLPVRSVLVLLRQEAESPFITGRLEQRNADGNTTYLTFEYIVLRVWQLPVADILAGGLATLPLAPLATTTRDALPEVVKRMDERIMREAAPDEAKMLWASTYILLGLKYPAAFATQLLKGVGQMRESTTYQAILEEGRQEGLQTGRQEGAEIGARETILRLGSRRFGSIPQHVTEALNAIHSFERLEVLADRLLEAESWDELLASDKESH